MPDSDAINGYARSAIVIEVTGLLEVGKTSVYLPYRTGAYREEIPSRFGGVLSLLTTSSAFPIL